MKAFLQRFLSFGCSFMMISLPPFLAVYFFHGASTKLHGAILGASTLLFAICDVLFAYLFKEINNAYKSGAVNLGKIERLHDRITTVKRRFLGFFLLQIVLRLSTAIIGIILFNEPVSDDARKFWFLVAGYTCFGTGLALLLQFVLYWWELDSFNQRLLFEEKVSSERKRMLEELKTGKQPDGDDKQLKGYTTVLRKKTTISSMK